MKPSSFASWAKGESKLMPPHPALASIPPGTAIRNAICSSE
jgi:hypothetical protein